MKTTDMLADMLQEQYSMAATDLVDMNYGSYEPGGREC